MKSIARPLAGKTRKFEFSRFCRDLYGKQKLLKKLVNLERKENVM